MLSSKQTETKHALSKGPIAAAAAAAGTDRALIAANKALSC